MNNIQHISCNNYTRTSVVKWCLEHILGMTNYNVNVTYCIFLNIMQTGAFIPPNQISISQDIVPPDDFCTLFHELRHYYQFKTGMFNFNPQDYMYDFPENATPEAKSLISHYSYTRLPWEIDANEFAKETLKKFWKTPIGKTFLNDS